MPARPGQPQDTGWAGGWPRALIFDLDGTLVDSAPDLTAALDHVLATYGRPPRGLDEVRHMVGDGARVLLERGFAATGGPPPDGIDAAMTRFLDYYRAHIADHGRPFPGVVEQIRRARAAGCRIAVCTNKTTGPTTLLLDALDLQGLVDTTVCGDTLPTRKPDPAMVSECLRRFDVTPDQAVMLGDSHNDVAAARGAGVPVVVVTFGYTAIPPAELGGNALLDRYDDLPEVLAGMRSVMPSEVPAG
ncbi:phosphoglycolate phosphatase [Marinibaculum pumilum]|uniref:Phosphoglycolate phosphatase n=1 Tax=Marinibaculum pumilum TaxID=1766165 RepID=A0ABV7L3Z2_9PROT